MAGKLRHAPRDRLAAYISVGGQGKSGASPAWSRHCDRVEEFAGALARQPLEATLSFREGASSLIPEARRPVPGQAKTTLEERVA
jgi:hypothetical protein